MSDPTPPSALLEELACALALADAADAGTLLPVRAALQAFSRALEASDREALRQAARAAEVSLADVVEVGEGDAPAALRQIAALVEQARAPERERPAAAGPAASAPARGEEEAELLAEVLSEIEENVARADRILLAAKGEALDPAAVHDLFRAFHTVKGVAGFADLKDLVQLAHATEALLDCAREGRVLQGSGLELIFDATAVLAQLAGAVHDPQAAADSRARLPSLVAQLNAEVSGTASSAAASPAPAPVSVVPAPAAAPSPAPAAKPTLKVDVQRVDSLVDMIGELIIVESMVASAPELHGGQSARLRNFLSQLSKISRDLQDVALRMRMVPVRGLFQKMARLARDLSKKTGKNLQLVAEGEDTELDRSMVEALEEPLVHMLRNAVDHGVEAPQARQAKGKPAQATLKLSAVHEGGHVVIALSDDGKGLDRAAILGRARERGLVAPDVTPADVELCNLIFAPGFSTAKAVTELSGRGVGMDVVKRGVEALRGRVTVSSVEGAGTSFRLVLPLTLAIIDGMVVGCGPERYIVPSLAVKESLRPSPEMLVTLGESQDYLSIRGELLPLLKLADVFSIPEAERDPTRALAVIVESMGEDAALLVDDVVAQQQIVTKPLSSALADARYFSGAAILSNGLAGLILNVDQLASLADRRRRPVPAEHSRAVSEVHA